MELAAGDAASAPRSVGLKPALAAAMVVALLVPVGVPHAVAGEVGTGAAVADTTADVAHVLIYSGTVAHRHGEAIDNGIGPIQDALDDVGITYDWVDCDGAGTGNGQCQHPDNNPSVFTPENLEQYDALFFFNAGGHTGASGASGPLWNESDRAAIQGFVNDGGGIAANHLATDIGAGQVSWGWWDGIGNSAIGSTMPGHPAAPQTGNIIVSDKNHPATHDLPDEWPIDDEFYMFDRSVRGTHHVLMTLDEYTPGFDPGSLAMGQDHPVAWCRRYDGGRIYANALGHYGGLYQPVDGEPSNLVKSLIGGIQWVAGVEGTEGDCGGTVWSNFRRTTIADDVQGPIGLDIADDGRVYWTEIGEAGHTSEGRLRMYDPDTDDDTVVATILTRADALGSSEDGVLAMVLDPDFVDNNYVYIYYSPRGEDEDWPNSGSGMVLGYNLVSRFELDDTGTEVVGYQEIIRIPKVKVAPDGDGATGDATTNWPAHTGGAGMDFDSEGNLYIGVGDDVNPFDANRNYSPIDQRYEHRYDARNTSANTNDLRGKVLRIVPLADASGEAGIDNTYSIPEGNMFEPGTPETKPEIYVMGFRQPFSVHADPANPGTIVVGEYGPDAGSNHPDRGPAGIIEWNHIEEPGFHGWPFCTGDNSPANTYFRFTYPSGPSGDQFDCSLDEIPNESDYNTGMDNIPGPAVPATIWHKRDGSTPMWQGIPPAGGSQEANSGPIYRYDPDNPSETKWPAYYDGSWIIYNRSQNWWREVKLHDDGSLLTANPFPAPSDFGDGPASNIIPTRFGPDGALYAAAFHGRGSNSLLMRIDYVGNQADEEAPEVSATVSGIQGPGGAYVGRATVNIEAADIGFAGVDRVEYSLDGGDWETLPNDNFSEPFLTTLVVSEPGAHEVVLRAVDREGNVSDEETVSFTVIAGESCTFLYTDYFDGDEVDTDKWIVRTGNDHEVTQSDGALHLPVLWEVDGTATGPISFVGQQVPDGDWSVTTRVTIDHETNWQQAGLMIWQSDDNFVKLGFTYHSPTNTNFEITSDNPPDGEREFSTHVNGNDYGPTVWLRLFREGNTIGGALADDIDGEPGPWTVHPGTRPVDTDPPREGEGVLVGPYAGGQPDAPWNNTASFDLVEFAPDVADCPGDGIAPTTTALIDGEAPEDHYDDGVVVSLSATDDDEEDATGVDYIEYRSGTSGAWTREDNEDDDDPFTIEFEVLDEGAHTIQFRAADRMGNIEDTNELSFTIGDVGGGEAEIFASDIPTLYQWVPDHLSVDLGDEVTWRFDNEAQGGTATVPHNLFLVRPGDDPLQDGFQVGPTVISPGGDPVTYVFDEPGSWVFYCQLHVSAGGDGNWEGMVGTIEVSGDIPEDTTPPVTTATIDGDPVSGSYVGEVELQLSATDGTSPNATGVDHTEYVVDGPEGTFSAEPSNPDGDDPFVTTISLEDLGDYTIEFRSVDVAGNVEQWQTVEFEIVEDDDGPVDPPHQPVCDQHQGNVTFPDSRGSGHQYFIDCLASLEIVGGFTDGLYHPRRDVTRAQLASFVVRAIETVTGERLEAGGALFPDVSPGSTHGQAIYKLRNAGIIQGFGDGMFRPTQSVSRDQTARYVVNALELLLEEPLATSGARFPDVTSGQYVVDIDKLVTAGVVGGFPDGTFGPRQPVTRGQMARFIGNKIEVLAEAGVW